MGNRLTSLIDLPVMSSKNKSCQFLLAGLDASGKTTLLYRWSHGQVVTTIPTIGFNVEEGQLLDGTVVTAWDVGGRDKSRPIMYKYYFPGMDAIVYCVDSKDPDRFDQARDELHVHLLQSDELQGKPLVVFCNKQDLPGALSVEEITQRLGLDQKCKSLERRYRILPCSATTGQGVDYGLQWLSNAIQKQRTSHFQEKIATVAEEMTPDTLSNATERNSAPAYNVQKNNETIEKFRPIQLGTECPFAKAAKLWGGCDGLWDLHETLDTNAAALKEFVKQSNAGEALDGFCIALPGDGGPETLGRRVRALLSGLSDRDPANEKVLHKNYIDRRGWRFRFAGADFFVTSFAPCYPITSSRYAFGAEAAFVLLQPELSFYRHSLPPDTPETANPPKTVRDKARLAYAKAGRSYHIPSTTRYPPAEHLVKPLYDDGISVIRWWLEQVETFRTSNSTLPPI